MTCDDVLDLVDAIASGDVPLDADVRAHLAACPRCAAALAFARRIEALIAARPAPAPPANFTSTVRREISRERWRAEQSVDWLFNFAVAVGLAIVVGGVAGLMNQEGLLAAAGTGWVMATTVGSEFARQAVPAVTTYVAAGGLLVSTLAIWWWAERKLSL